MHKQQNEDVRPTVSPKNGTARETIDTVFYGLDKLMRLFGTGVSIIALIWFGTTCFKLGWGARDNPFLQPIGAGLLGLEDNPDQKVDNFGEWLQRETRDVLEQFSEEE